MEVTNEENPRPHSHFRRFTSRSRDHGVSDPLHRGVDKVEGAVKDAEDELKVKFSSPMHGGRRGKGSPQPSSSHLKPSDSSGNDEDEEEGWASELSDSGQQPIAGPSSAGGRAGTPNSGGRAGTPPSGGNPKTDGKKRRVFGIGRKGRQRVSLRRTLTGGHIGSRHTDSSRDDTASASDSEEPRGRTINLNLPGRLQSHSRSSTPHAIIISAPPSPTSSPAHSSYFFQQQQQSQSKHRHPHSRGASAAEQSAIDQRLENIRLQASKPPTREASPSRSVRFVDGPGTPPLSTRTSRILDFTPPGPGPIASRSPPDTPGLGPGPIAFRSPPDTPTPIIGVEKAESSGSGSTSSGSPMLGGGGTGGKR